MIRFKMKFSLFFLHQYFSIFRTCRYQIEKNVFVPIPDHLYVKGCNEHFCVFPIIRFSYFFYFSFSNLSMSRSSINEMFKSESYREIVIFLRRTWVPQIDIFEIDCDVRHLHIEVADMLIKRELAKSQWATECHVKIWLQSYNMICPILLDLQRGHFSSNCILYFEGVYSLDHGERRPHSSIFS